MEWHEAFNEVRQHTFKIMTPDGHGTGFFIARTSLQGIIAIATAAHVVNRADHWRQPMRIQHAGTKGEIFLEHSDREVFINEDEDIASILFAPEKLFVPDVAMPLTTENRYYKIGVDVGWAGYPSISPSPDDLCFFNGRISCRINQGNKKYYLVDGVAINGVSGGPAFVISGNTIKAMGIVSAYIPNQAMGVPTPGLCVLRDVMEVRETVTILKDLDDMRKKAKSNTSAEAPPPPNKK